MNNPFLGLYEVMAEATKVEASFFIAKIIATECNVEHNLKDKLEVNDKVILLRIDDKFIILDKVVSI